MKESVDRGYSWVVLISCFIMYILCAGCMKTYGILYGELQRTFSSGSGNTVSVGSIAGFLQSVSSPLANSLCMMLSFRTITFTGGILISLAFLLSGFVPTLQWLFFTYSVIGGLGLGFVFTPCITIVNFYFERRRNLAIGIVQSAGGVSQFILPHLYRYLFDTYPLVGALMLLSALYLHICVAASILRQPVILQSEKRNSCPEQYSNSKTSDVCVKSIKFLKQLFKDAFNFDWALLKNWTYVLFVVSASFGLLGYTSNFYLIPPMTVSLGFGKQKAAFTMTVLGLCELISRVFFGWFLDLKVVSVKMVFIFIMMIGGIAAELLPVIQKYEYICVYVGIIGSFPGALYIMIPALLVEEIGLKRLPKAYGLIFLFSAILYVIGNPALGWLEDTTGNWNASFHVVGVLFFLSAITMISQAIYSKGKSGKSLHDANSKMTNKADPKETETML